MTTVLQGNKKQIIIIFGHQRHQETNDLSLYLKFTLRIFSETSKTAELQKKKKNGNGAKSCSSVSVLQVDLLVFATMFYRVAVSELVLFPQGVCGLEKLSLGAALVIGKEAWRRKTGQRRINLQQCLMC